MPALYSPLDSGQKGCILNNIVRLLLNIWQKRRLFDLAAIRYKHLNDSKKRVFRCSLTHQE